MARPNLTERVKMLASVPDEVLTRFRDLGLKLEIAANGTVTLQGSPKTANTEADLIRQADEKMRKAFE